METREKELKKALEENRLFGYILSNYNDWSKEELARMIAEMNYVANKVYDMKDYELIDQYSEYSFLSEEKDQDIDEHELEREEYEI